MPLTALLRPTQHSSFAPRLVSNVANKPKGSGPTSTESFIFKVLFQKLSVKVLDLTQRQKHCMSQVLKSMKNKYCNSLEGPRYLSLYL